MDIIQYGSVTFETFWGDIVTPQTESTDNISGKLRRNPVKPMDKPTSVTLLITTSS